MPWGEPAWLAAEGCGSNLPDPEPLTLSEPFALRCSITYGTTHGMKEKIILLIPLSFNDGTAIPEPVLDQIFADLYVLCDGYRIAGRGPGAYRMADGTKQVEETMEVWAAIDTADVPKLAAIVRRWCVLLKQECIWFERTGATVEFLGPTEAKGDANG